jgi:pimeloyl-ACP methyl ester carboxylesterase
MIRVFRWAAASLVILLLGLASAGAVYQVVGTWRDPRRFRRQGRLVQAGGVRLNIDCSGQGRPVVVLESAFGVPAAGWMTVQPDVAGFARVCSYDRAGYGWSDVGPEPRTSQQIAVELHTLLKAAGEKGPYVLVGHSFGGFNVRLFTKLYPTEVAGVVLVDAAHEDEDERIDALNALLPGTLKERRGQRDQRNARINRVWRPLRLHLGLRRLEMATGWGLAADDPDRRISNQLRQEIFYLQRQDKSQRATASESASFEVSKAQVRAAGTLGDRPLIVLTAERPYAPDPLLTAELMDRLNQVWINELQLQEMRLSTRGKQIVVPNSSHVIPYNRPDAVITAIREVRAEAIQLQQTASATR